MLDWKETTARLDKQEVCMLTDTLQHLPMPWQAAQIVASTVTSVASVLHRAHQIG